MTKAEQPLQVCLLGDFRPSNRGATVTGLRQRSQHLTDPKALGYLETALRAYQDDLWPDCDAEWIYPDQERLRQHHIRALAQATRRLKDLGETDRAIILGQQWLEDAPWMEGATKF